MAGFLAYRVPLLVTEVRAGLNGGVGATLLENLPGSVGMTAKMLKQAKSGERQGKTLEELQAQVGRRVRLGQVLWTPPRWVCAVEQTLPPSLPLQSLPKHLMENGGDF